MWKSKLRAAGGVQGTGCLHLVKQINKVMRREKGSILGNYRTVADSFCLETGGCIPAVAELGKSRLLIDKECLLTDQRQA